MSFVKFAFDDLVNSVLKFYFPIVLCQDVKIIICIDFVF